MEFQLKLEGEGAPIELGVVEMFEESKDVVINRVDLLISQEDLDTNDRSENMFCTLDVYGEIKDRTKTVTCELLRWSLKTDKKTAYKNVTLVMKDNDEELRSYQMGDMYCVSYSETFPGRSSDGKSSKDTYGSFVLKLRQRKGSLGSIGASC